MEILKCGYCQTEKEKTSKRLPRDWKHYGSSYSCGKCWHERFVLRAIIIPVVEPMDSSWDELNKELKAMFRETTRASNWMVTELAKRDILRQPDQEKMPSMPKAYLYPEARIQFPALPPQTVSAIEQAVQRKYKAKRYETIWTLASSLPTYRYPQPFPVHNQSWSPAIVSDRPQVSVRIGDRRFILRLKGGPRYRRQLGAFRSMCSGDAQYGELALYRSGTDLLCKMVAWVPKPAARDSEGTLFVRTSLESLLVAFNAKDEKLWIWNADHIKRWSAEHQRILQRWSEDQKAEQRPVPDFAARRTAATEKYRDRMNTAADQAAAYLANYATRRKFAILEYDDSERGYCPDFIWFRLKDRIKTILDERGIEFRESKKEVASV